MAKPSKSSRANRTLSSGTNRRPEALNYNEVKKADESEFRLHPCCFSCSPLSQASGDARWKCNHLGLRCTWNISRPSLQRCLESQSSTSPRSSDSMQSQPRIKVSSEAEVLELILNYGTRIERPRLQIRGASTLGADEVTDFDLQYDCLNHIKRERTCISYPHPAVNGILNVSALEKYIQSGFENPRVYSHLTFLRSWAKAEIADGPSSTAGIYFEHILQGLPQTAHISRLATSVAYSGKISTNFYHDQPERRLLGFGHQWPPESKYCLHIRTTWCWTPSCLDAAPSIDSRPLQSWERIVQQAIAGRHIGPLTDAGVPPSGLRSRAPVRKQSSGSDESRFDLATPAQV